MATVLPAMIMAPSFNHHASQCIDPEQDFFDFNELASPAPAALKRESSTLSVATSPANTLLDEDLQTPAKPSYEYERFKQQTGYPTGSIPGLGSGYNSGFSLFSSTGLDEMSLMNDSSMLDAGWNSGLSVDTSMHMGMDLQQPTYFFPNNTAQDDFVDPSVITQEEAPRVRVYPGHHQQQAAKAQALAQQQQQQQRQQQQQQQQQQQMAHHRQHSQNRLQPQQANRKTASPLSDARTEETIARVVAQIRQNSQNAALASQEGQQNLMPHIIRAKKDEDDMDEDERLLASEEGKKLSSKERRQLRNKVSARAFRSRRKEYIGQLEGEIAQKAQEANELRTQNIALMEENARSRAFIERLLRHQAFVPFLDDISREECLQSKAPVVSVPLASTPAVIAPTPAPFQPQQFAGMPPSDNTHVGMTLVPETQMDFSMLNINNNGNNPTWNVNNFQQPRVFAVLEVPEGPANPLDIEAMSGKGYSALFAAEDDSAVEEIKPDFPVIERPAQSQTPAVAAPTVEEDEDDEYALYYSSPAPSSAAPSEISDNVFGTVNSEKALSHFNLVISDEAEEVRSMERLERRMAAMEPCLQRIAALTSMLDL